MENRAINWVKNDGGREAAGFTGRAGDCVCRAIAIAAELPYKDVYKRLAAGMGSQRRGKGEKKSKRSARSGISVKRKWFKDYMKELGFVWVPTMQIGSGCRVHLAADELPAGRIIVSLSKHYAAVIDGVLHDNHDCSRGGTRCVYGYWARQDVETTYVVDFDGDRVGTFGTLIEAYGFIQREYNFPRTFWHLSDRMAESPVYEFKEHGTVKELRSAMPVEIPDNTKRALAKESDPLNKFFYGL